MSPGHPLLSKGLTGGSVPLAVTLCRRADLRGAFFERPLANVLPFELLHRQSDRLRGGGRQPRDLATEPVIERIATLAEHQARLPRSHCGATRVSRSLRQLGTITAFELADAGRGISRRRRALACAQSLLERGVLLRPLGNTIYVMPPYCTTKDELKSVYRALTETLDEVLA